MDCLKVFASSAWPLTASHFSLVGTFFGFKFCFLCWSFDFKIYFLVEFKIKIN